MRARRAGEYRHRVTIERKVVTQDPNTGFESVDWQPLHTDVQAAFRPLTSRELQAAGARQSRVSAEFEIADGLDVTGEDRIIHLGDVWELEPPQPGGFNRMVKIKAARGLTSG